MLTIDYCFNFLSKSFCCRYHECIARLVSCASTEVLSQGSSRITFSKPVPASQQQPGRKLAKEQEEGSIAHAFVYSAVSQRTRSGEVCFITRNHRYFHNHYLIFSQERFLSFCTIFCLSFLVLSGDTTDQMIDVIENEVEVIQDVIAKGAFWFFAEVFILPMISFIWGFEEFNEN